jgi:hypothetical protein
VYVLRDEVTAENYLGALLSFVAVGGVIGSPSGTVAAPLYTTSGGTTAFNGTGPYSILVYAADTLLARAVNNVEFTNGGAAISWTDLQEVSAMTGGPALTALTENVWYDNTISAGVHEYQFYAHKGTTYFVSWNNGYEGDGTKNGNIQVSAAWKSGGTGIFSAQSYGFTNPKRITADKSGYIKITVEKPSWGNAGTYGLIYWEEDRGNSVFQIDFSVNPGGDMGVSGDIKLDQNDNDQITISVGNAEAYTGFRWFVDDTEVAGEINDNIILSAAAYSPGVHQLTAVAYRDGVPYSEEISFAVVP